MVTAQRVWAKRGQRIALTALLSSSLLIGGCSLNENPYESKTVKGDEQVQLIDSMRNKGSYEDARQRLTNTARVIADRIVAAVPGQTWQFTQDPNVQNVNANGLPCEQLTGDIAGRPISDSVDFGRPFAADEFSKAADIVRQEAAQYGATEESCLFNEDSKRDFNIQGNGYEFELMQSKAAILDITGDCFLMQSVLDLPAGQLPPEPPIVPPTTPTR
ncbi:hypothetical protein NIIDNTM18_21770 [Mycolicibacterium litorale]|uniref:Lipoprotein LppA n=1 Tax=Mycolicibacterium litorale TaxID=758802 RepID=A0A6S6P346_9MYCO|nr:LppA family lipoprotein [Mycolicibacterium litorale]BCI52899.1 hypothetical protein NIIDNTM18_21770 [Mycolicibacterium litorale]